MTKGKILVFLKEQKEFLAQNYGITSIGLFGSYARDEAKADSEIDIAVKIDSEYLKTHDVWDYFDAIRSIQQSILKQFHLKSDIFDIDSISPFREQIMKDIIYV